jgi:hypothetical protein
MDRQQHTEIQTILRKRGWMYQFTLQEGISSGKHWIRDDIEYCTKGKTYEQILEETI